MHECRSRHAREGGVLSVTLENVDIASGTRNDLIDLDPGTYLRLWLPTRATEWTKR